MVLTEHSGFVWGKDGDELIVQLRTGARIRCKDTGGFDTGDRVSVVPDVCGKKILSILTLADAKHAVRCGVDPMYAAFCRDEEILPPDEEEVLDDIECGESDDVYGIAT